MPAHGFGAVHMPARIRRACLGRREHLARRVIAQRRARLGDGTRTFAVQANQLAYRNRIPLDAVRFRRQFDDAVCRHLHRVIEFERTRAPVHQIERGDGLPTFIYRHLCARARLDPAVRTVKMCLVVLHRRVRPDVHPNVHPMFQFRRVRKRAVCEEFRLRQFRTR